MTSDSFWIKVDESLTQNKKSILLDPKFDFKFWKLFQKFLCQFETVQNQFEKILGICGKGIYTIFITILQGKGVVRYYLSFWPPPFFTISLVLFCKSKKDKI